MTRAIPTGTLADLYAPTQATHRVDLVTLSSAELASPLRYVNDTMNLESRGNTFAAFAFTVSRPASRANERPRAQLVLDMVDRTVIVALRSIRQPLTVLIEEVDRAAPDTVIQTVTMRGVAAPYTVSSAVVELAPGPVLDEAYPGIEFTPVWFPGAFAR